VVGLGRSLPNTLGRRVARLVVHGSPVRR
jgi:hypothetical protein